MIILASKDLDKHGISHQSSSQFIFKGRVFTKGQTFAAHLRDVAIELVQENLTLGQPCILVDYDSHVTLWRVPRSSRKMTSHLSPTPIGQKKIKANASSKRSRDERARRARPTRTQ